MGTLFSCLDSVVYEGIFIIYVIMIPIYMLCVTKKWIYLRKVGML